MWTNSEEIIGQLALRCLYLSNKWPYQNWKVGVVVESRQDQDKIGRAIALNLRERYGQGLCDALFKKIAFIRTPQDVYGLQLLPILYCSHRFRCPSWKSTSKLSKELRLLHAIFKRINIFHNVAPQYLSGEWEWGDSYRF